jgi:hypothetical protein
MMILLVVVATILLTLVVVAEVPRIRKASRKRYIDRGIKQLEEFVNKED